MALEVNGARTSDDTAPSGNIRDTEDRNDALLPALTLPVSAPTTIGTNRTLNVGTVFTLMLCGVLLVGHVLSLRSASVMANVGSRSTSTRVVVRMFAPATSRFQVDASVPSTIAVRTLVSGAVIVAVCSSVVPS